VDEKAYTITGPADTVNPMLQNLNCIGKTVAGSLVAAHIYDNRIRPTKGVTIDRMSLQDFFIYTVGGKRNE
jgi:hypothetical protein